MSTLRQTLEQHYRRDNTFVYSFIMSKSLENDLDEWMQDWDSLIEVGLIVLHHTNPLNVVYKLSDSLPVWEFGSTSEAYDNTQCNSAIKSGDILYIPNRKCVGIADTWPVAITEGQGQLHTPKEGVTQEEMNNSMNEYRHGDTRINFHLSFKQAVALAAKHNYPVLECFA